LKPSTLQLGLIAAATAAAAAVAASGTGEFIEPLLPTLAPGPDVPLHVQHMSERLGQLVMFHLGEAVIGIAATPLESTVPQFTAVGLAATLAWSLHLTYHHVEPDEHSHAYRQSRLRGLLYFYFHWLLTVALLLTGSSLRLLLGERV
jgi:low temperature requirement protein LtrA